MASKVHATGDKITRHDNTITTPRQPLKTTIFRKDTGEAHEVFVVDAREILAVPDSLYRAEKEAPAEPAAVSETVGSTTTGTAGSRAQPTGVVTPVAKSKDEAPAKTKEDGGK